MSFFSQNLTKLKIQIYLKLNLPLNTKSSLRILETESKTADAQISSSFGGLFRLQQIPQ